MDCYDSDSVFLGTNYIKRDSYNNAYENAPFNAFDSKEGNVLSFQSEHLDVASWELFELMNKDGQDVGLYLNFEIYSSSYIYNTQGYHIQEYRLYTESKEFRITTFEYIVNTNFIECEVLLTT